MNKEIALENLIDFVPDINNQNPNPLSDPSDPSDQPDSGNKENPISISECLRRHSGNVLVQGTITSMSRLYKMVKSVTIGCSNCDSNAKSDYQIPKSFPANTTTNQKCGDCKDGMKWQEYEYVNAVSVELQDSTHLAI